MVLGPGGLDILGDPVTKGSFYLGVPLESQRTGTQVTNLALLERKTHEEIITRKNAKILPRLKMSPENQWLEDVLPMELVPVTIGDIR